MSEKDKSQSKEMAELLAENPEAATYIAGVVQGMLPLSSRAGRPLTRFRQSSGMRSSRF